MLDITASDIIKWTGPLSWDFLAREIVGIRIMSILFFEGSQKVFEIVFGNSNSWKRRIKVNLELLISSPSTIATYYISSSQHHLLKIYRKAGRIFSFESMDIIRSNLSFISINGPNFQMRISWIAWVNRPNKVFN